MKAYYVMNSILQYIKFTLKWQLLVLFFISVAGTVTARDWMVYLAMQAERFLFRKVCSS